MKNFLLGIVIGYASSHSSKHLIHLTPDRLFGFQRRMGLSMATVTSLASHQTAKSYGKNSVAKIKTVIRYDPKAFGKRWSVHVLLAAQYRGIALPQGTSCSTKAAGCNKRRPNQPMNQTAPPRSNLTHSLPLIRPSACPSMSHHFPRAPFSVFATTPCR